MNGFEFVLVGLAAIAGGAVNAIAGGGTLITFPMLTAVGVPAVAANVTNTVALCPGYLGGTFAQLNDLRGQQRRIWLLLPMGVLGGIAGGILLLNTGEQLFRALVPYLILLAAALLAMQDLLCKWIVRRANRAGSATAYRAWSGLALTSTAVYGGLFRRGDECDRSRGARARAGRHTDTAERSETGYRFQRQHRGRRLLPFFRTGRVVGDDSHVCRRTAGRSTGRSAGRLDSAGCAALDRCYDRHRCRSNIFHPLRGFMQTGSAIRIIAFPLDRRKRMKSECK